jgi:hypothetical protein
MKNLMIAAVLIFLGASVQAKQFGILPDNYLRPIDLAHPVTSLGVYIDAKNLGRTTVGKSLALVTHDPKDGCLLPAIVCEQWAPIVTGLSVTGGRLFWDVGSGVNLAPMFKAGLLGFFNEVTPDDSLVGLKSALAPSQSPLTVAFGPNLGLNPVNGGVLQPFNKWDPRLVIFTGAQYKW